jgi:hypothetical protein
MYPNMSSSIQERRMTIILFSAILSLSMGQVVSPANDVA